MPRVSRKGRPEAIFWSSKTRFVLAAIGAVIGFNDFTQFPYLVAHYGGAAFLVVYFFGILLISVPLMASDLLVGRYGRSDPAAAVARLAADSGASRHWGALGWLMVAGGFMAAAYFSIVASWMSGYLVRVGLDVFSGLNGEGAGRLFAAYVQDPERQLFWFTLFLACTMATSAAGVRKGIERVLPWVMVLALTAFLGLVTYGYILDPAGDAANRLFTPDFNRLSAVGIVIALGHAFFGLSLGTGALFGYGAYLPDDVPVLKWSFWIALIDAVVGTVAGLIIYPVAIAQGLKPVAGPTLLFDTLPVAFDHLPYGNLAGAAFFLVLVAVAWMASIAFVEPVVQWMMRRRQMGRASAALTIGLALWVTGIVGVLSLNYLAFPFHFFGELKTLGLFDVLATATFDVVLPLSSLALALFVGWRASPALTERAMNALSPCIYEIWLWSVRLITPLLLILILFNLKSMAL